MQQPKQFDEGQIDEKPANANERELTQGLATSAAWREYELLHTKINSYDHQCLLIKSWSVTLSAVAIGFGFIEKNPSLFLLASISAAVFWYIEGMYKNFHRVAIERADIVERKIRDKLDFDGPAVGLHFQKKLGFGSSFRTLRFMTYENVYLPHFFIVLLGIYFWKEEYIRAWFGQLFTQI